MVKPQKCEWAVTESNWLGHWLTPNGIQPWKKKIEPILALQKPTTVRQLRRFIGMINFYRNMWKGRSHVLATLTALLKFKGKNFASKWTAECEKSFDAIKAIISQETLLHYPDPNKPFHIEMDASDLQLGAVILQDNQPVAFYSRKLTSA